MAITWVEDSSSRSATIYRLGRRDPSTRVRVFNVFGTSDEDVLHADCNTKISTTYPYWTHPGSPLVKLRAESYSVEYLGDIAWKVSINYANMGADDPSQTGPLKRARSFDTTGGSQHVTSAVKTDDDIGERIYGPAGENDGATMQGSIGVDDGRVNGVDIIVPSFKWTETYDVPSSFVTDAYIRKVAFLTGKTNAATFRGFAAGEVLFAGATGSHEWDTQKGNSPCPLSFHFIAEPNTGPGQTMPEEKVGTISGIVKKGHEYLWVRYTTEVDATKQQVVRVPQTVYVNRVYKTGDFSVLGIGVA